MKSGDWVRVMTNDNHDRWQQVGIVESISSDRKIYPIKVSFPDGFDFFTERELRVLS